MTRREIDAIWQDSEGEPKFTPGFASKFDVMQGVCNACHCQLGDHWEFFHGDQRGWVGCTYALRKEVERLKVELAKRAS